MQARKNGDGWILRLDRGEELMSTLGDWMRETAIPGGKVEGIGALRDCELGYFDVASSGYRNVLFPESMEVVSLVANLGWADDQPVVHAHAVLAGPDLVARGGHLWKGTVSVTVELYVTPSAAPVRRVLDPEVGLKLMDLEQP